MEIVWQFSAWLSPLLWLTFLVKAIAFRRFCAMPIWVCYSVIAIPFDIAWAFTFVRWTTPYIILGLVMRIAATLEAVCHILRAVKDEEGHHYAVMSALWIGCAVGLAVLLRYDPRGLVAWITTSVRIGCSVALLVALGSWAGHRLRQVPYCFLHGALMTVWMSSSALAAAMGKHHGAEARGDGWDLFAIVVRDLTLLGWIWLIGPRMLTLRLERRDIVLPSGAATS